LAIKPSAGRAIHPLIVELSSGNASTRDAAVARLAVLGNPAVASLISVVDSNAPACARIAALQALEAIASPRAIDAALQAIDDADPAVAAAALSTAQTFLRSSRGGDVVDRVTQIALDPTRRENLRLAAIEGLSTLTPETLLPLWMILAEDSSPPIRARARAALSRKPAAPAPGPLGQVSAAAEGPLPDDPVALGRAVAAAAAAAPLPLLQRLVDRIREREDVEPPQRRAEWARTRAAAHLALADRGSRLALYDLRESFERATAPLPVEFLAALSQIGDASCLEAIAAAYVKTAAPSPGAIDWWRAHLTRAFQTIVKREGLTRRHGVIRKIARRWGDATRGLSATFILREPPA
jgi:HEAT repeat protein